MRPAVTQQLRRRVALLCGVGVVLGLVWLLGLQGCGAVVNVASPTAGDVNAAGDECLFAGADNADKSNGSAVLAEGGAEKAYLPTTGEWRADDVLTGQWERHRFSTVKDQIYIVELIANKASYGGDVDLCLSRDEDPYHNRWKRSSEVPPRCDVIVFRSNRTGTMYVGVVAPNVAFIPYPEPYEIRVRTRGNPLSG